MLWDGRKILKPVFENEFLQLGVVFRLDERWHGVHGPPRKGNTGGLNTAAMPCVLAFLPS